jgi:hypothetical protein
MNSQPHCWNRPEICSRTPRNETNAIPSGTKPAPHVKLSWEPGLVQPQSVVAGFIRIELRRDQSRPRHHDDDLPMCELSAREPMQSCGRAFTDGVVGQTKFKATSSMTDAVICCSLFLTQYGQQEDDGKPFMSYASASDFLNPIVDDTKTCLKLLRMAENALILKSSVAVSGMRWRLEYKVVDVVRI